MTEILEAIGLEDWRAAAVMLSAMLFVSAVIFLVASVTNRARKHREKTAGPGLGDSAGETSGDWGCEPAPNK